MSFLEYQISKSQRDNAIRAILDAKHDWKGPKQNIFPQPHGISHEPDVVQAQPVEEEYEVEHIMEKKIKQGKTFYLVKWRGYPPEEATWEPLENLEHAPLKIKDFESQIQMYDPLNETANLKKPTKNPEPGLMNKIPEPTSLIKTPSMEAVLPSQPTLVPNPYMPENLLVKPMLDTRGVEINREIENENKNRKIAEKKATSNSSTPNQLSADKKSQKSATKTRMEEEPVRREGNIKQDDMRMANSGNKGNNVVQKELVRPKEDKGVHPHEKITNRSPEEENPVVKMRKLNSDTRERNLLRSEVETHLTSPTSLGSSGENQRKAIFSDEERVGRAHDFLQKMMPKPENFMPTAPEHSYQSMIQSYHQMLNPSNLLQSELTQIQSAYQRVVNGNHTGIQLQPQKEHPKSIAATTYEPVRGPSISAAKMMQTQKTETTPETDDHNGDSPQRSTTKLKKKDVGEAGSFEKGDVPFKIIGIRPMPEINDLEILIDWKARDNGTKPYNSKVRRVDLLRYGHFMPLIEFYESKMRLETAPNFDPKLLTKY